MTDCAKHYDAWLGCCGDLIVVFRFALVKDGGEEKVCGGHVPSTRTVSEIADNSGPFSFLLPGVLVWVEVLSSSVVFAKVSLSLSLE